MSNEEAIKILNDCHSCRNVYNGECTYKECFEAKTLAINALRKQIPQPLDKVPLDDDGLYFRNECPGCNTTYAIKYDFCPKCGQALDWGK